MSPAPILVLIVNYRTAALTMRAVEAILPEIRARGDAHILIVDNGSDDGSVQAIAAGIERLKIADCCSLLALDINLGFAGGNNAGLARYRDASGGRWPEFIWLLNPDTEAEPGALNTLVDFLADHPGAGLAGGRCLRPDGSIRHSAFRFHSPLTEFVTALDFGPIRRVMSDYDVVLPIGQRPCRTEWLSGSHLMVRGTVFERIGLLDPAYFLYFEETDFCARAADAGFEAWHVPASRIVHLGGQSTGVTEAQPRGRRPRYWFASRARFLLRRHGAAKTHLANLLWLVATPIGSVIAHLRGRPRQEPPRLWRDFLCHYYGPRGLMYRTRELAA
ncbi:glycosyltransferase family 2 protein [Rhizorhabdus dicambivorans]|uniref:Glycosyl transferase n=1 Tax=Rhizorhabdus dicambivorans TaxID=1850238 RepID=A0A2A4FXC8_9SPHN|nr:glycosyltransferase family 2 protein [Rhizorhabdus dicambivorans]ATE66130.1 glycosyl transferase [Rhizorhabdus dicambivorans]PCE42056.1 glycosyl transferase [Rhizorhabdus dicambivorans]